MTKLSGLPPNTTPALADLLVMIQAAGPTDVKVTLQNILTFIFSGQLQTQANAGTAGGTMWYINLGGIKLLWFKTAPIAVTASTQVNAGVTWPTGFFSTIQSNQMTLEANTASNEISLFWNVTPTTVSGSISLKEFANVTSSQIVSGFIIGA